MSLEQKRTSPAQSLLEGVLVFVLGSVSVVGSGPQALTEPGLSFPVGGAAESVYTGTDGSLLLLSNKHFIC